jgi:uncharacterized protein with PQ loop repeat
MLNEFEKYAKIAVDFSMIFGPNIGFIAQIIKFRQVKSSEGFSKLISLIFIIANILRIYFWIGKQFSLVLLFQSIVAIIMHIILLKECLQLSNASALIKKDAYYYKDKLDIYKPINLFNVSTFWDWPFLIDYIYFLVLFAFTIGFISHIIGFDNPMYVESLGIASATVEACFGLPQVIANFNNKNTDTLSFFMLFTWALGDSFKTFYFLQTKAPLQMLICGLFQLTMDCVLLGQLLIYTYICPTVKLDKSEYTTADELEEDDEAKHIV